MNLKPEIRYELFRHRGHENALPRKKLLARLRRFEPDLTDREMRQIVSETEEILTCERGYYFAREGHEGKDDCEHSIEYLKKKIFPLWNRVQKIQKEHPEYYREEAQGRLF